MSPGQPDLLAKFRIQRGIVFGQFITQSVQMSDDVPIPVPQTDFDAHTHRRDAA